MPRIQSKNVYFPEYSKEFMNQNGPGPGKYEYEKVNQSFDPQRKIGAKFSKVSLKLILLFILSYQDSRKMSMPEKKDDSPLHYAKMEEYIK